MITHELPVDRPELPRAAGQIIDDLLRAAVAAPSPLNTQPWRFEIGGGGTTIDLIAEQDRILPVCDHDGRAARIACGAALFNLRLAAAVAGLNAKVTLLPVPQAPLRLARLDLAADRTVQPWERELSAAIPLRYTSREPYDATPVPAGLRASLIQAAAQEGAVLHFLGGDEAARVRRLAADAERELLANPAYRAEVACWVGRDRQFDGLPPSVLGPRSEVGRDPVRDFDAGRQQPVRYASFEEHPQFMVLSTKTDGPADWLIAGQALERVWLAATSRGLSLCPLNQPLETADAWLVRDSRSGTERPQMIMRVGYGPAGRRGTPRRPTSSVARWS